MSLKSTRRALLVTGMHRSGTSCVARIANLTGLAIGSNLLAPQPDNPTGFWEHAALSQWNDEILERLGTTWDSLAPLPDDWWRMPILDEAKQKLREIVLDEFGNESDFVIKDPRLCLLVPLWRELLTDLGCRVEFLIVVRDVRAVAASLERRDQFPKWHAELLWLRYVLMAEFHTRGERRVLVHYEDVLRDWRTAFAGISGEVDLPLPEPDDDAARAIESYVSSELDHATPDVLDRVGEPSPWSTSVMRALSREGALTDDRSLEELDRVRVELLAADPLLAPQDRHWRSEYLRLQREIDDVDGRFAVLGEGWQQHLNAIADRIDSDRETQNRILDRLDGLETESRRANEERWTRLSKERDDLQVRLDAYESECRSLRRELRLGHEQTRENRERIRTLDEELERVRQDQVKTRDLAQRDRIERERRIVELEGDLARAHAALSSTHGELDSHRRVLTNMVDSRSWKLTRPLRKDTWNAWLGRQDPFDASLRQPVPWHELLPGRPFRQRFSTPLAEIHGIRVGFFSYGRPNQTSVRVRVFGAPKHRRARQLVEERILRGDEIRDGQSSEIVFANAVRDAARKSFDVEIESLDGAIGKTVTVALGHANYRGRVLSRDRRGETRTRGLLVLELLDRTSLSRKAFAFVSGCPGDAYRYRCLHQAEMLRLRGYSIDVYPADEFPWPRLLMNYQVVVAHRVPHTPEFETFVAKAREQGVQVVFDTDDLVFAPEIEDQIAALDDLSESERDLWLDGVKRYRKSLSLVDRAIVSTTGLERSLTSRLDLEIRVSRNRLSDDMVAQAARARTRRSADAPIVRIGYLSGTPTHRRDFAECVPALARIMERRSQVRLSLVGHIDVPDALTPFEDRIDVLPLVPWQELPGIYADIDVNLAPLERNNEFTEGKSELKYLEAGLLAVPTVASAVGGYNDVIRSGQNGYVCDSEDAWVAAIDQLVTKPSLRERVGEAARRHVLEHCTCRRAACDMATSWVELLGPRDDESRLLRIAMVVRAPIANTGGGYKKIFHLVHYLSTRGHDVSVYVEPIAHLHGKSQAYIEDFCRKHFDCGDARIVAGHDSIEECDVAVATNWPTAAVVDQLPNARQRVYFIQDDEREFYAEDDPLRAEAAATYDLPLLIVGIGRYLPQLMEERNGLPYPHVDFALSDVFFEDRENTSAKIEAFATIEEPSLLFFARPGIPRRAFDLGVEALTRFNRSRPDVEIRLYGLEEPLELPFEYVDLGVIDQGRVASEMRKATAHLSFSRTNGSTVIFEAMASGAVAFELDAPGVRSLLDDPDACVLCEDSPIAVHRRLLDVFDDRDRMRRLARAGFESVSRFTIENMCRQFEEILLRHALSARGKATPQES